MFEKEIDESHPTRLDTEAAWDAEKLAMTLVGERTAKRDLVNLVRWLSLGGIRGIQVMKANPPEE